MSEHVVLDRHGIRVGGTWRTLLCSSLFYFRIPRELWAHRVRRLKEAGYTCVDVYFPWNFHEREDGSWDFDSGRDVDAFLGLLAEAGLWVVARPGPYICSEWDGGALPARILSSGMRIRENDPAFMAEVARWYGTILPRIAAREVGRGGTVILVQLDNELDFFDCPDPAAYMAALAALAREQGVSVPLFACAGQGSAARATGFAPGVDATFNFYPKPTDPHFDAACRFAASALAAVDRPLLITETNREHCLLRRELAAGARLLGAYNQVGGTNFGFTSSVNNWGLPSPLSFITSDYDFHSMIDPAGAYGPEAREARLLAGLIESLGESLACAALDEARDVTAACDFATSATGPSVLRLRDGGRLVCVPNLSDQAGTARVKGPGFELAASVSPLRSPFFPVDVPIDATGVKGRIAHASAEILTVAPGRLLFYADGRASATIVLEDGSTLRVTSGARPRTITRGSVRLEVGILSREEAADLWPGHPWDGLPAPRAPRRVRIASVRKARLDAPWRTVAPVAGCRVAMEDHGLSRGWALYDLGPDAGPSVLLQGVADLLTPYNGEQRLPTRVSGGQWQLCEGRAGTWRLKTEAWGHSNFDDSRLDSMRLASTRGIAACFRVLRREPMAGRWRFQLADEWLPAALAPSDHSFDPPLDLNSWNSTRRPLVARYRAEVTPDPGSTGLVLHVLGNRAEAAVYADGALVGVVNPYDPWIAVPTGAARGAAVRLELLCRKRDWAEPVGTATVFHVARLSPSVSALGEAELETLRAGAARAAALPLRVDRDHDSVLEVDLDGVAPRCAWAVVDAADLKLTAVYNGRIVGRLWGKSDNGPFLTGGNPTRCYLPGPWRVPEGNRLVLFVEPVGEHPEISSLVVEYART